MLSNKSATKIAILFYLKAFLINSFLVPELLKFLYIAHCFVFWVVRSGVCLSGLGAYYANFINPSPFLT